MDKKYNIFMVYNDKPSGMYDTLYKALDKSIKQNFPSANFIVEKNFSMNNPRYGKRVEDAMAYKWCEFAQKTTLPTIFIGCDLLVLRDFSEVFNDDFDLAVTIRDTKRDVLNNGVVFMKNTPEGKELMNEYAIIMDKMQKDKKLHHKYNKLIPVDQAAMEHLWRLHPERIKAYPCNIYNITQEYYYEPLHKDAAVLHVKSELRKTIFDKNFINKRHPKMNKNHHLVKLWNSYNV